jgi:hypothetical protein
MPLARIDLVQGKSDDYRRTVGDVVYEPSAVQPSRTAVAADTSGNVERAKGLKPPDLDLGKPPGLQLHGCINEVAPQISRFCYQPGGVCAVDDQHDLRPGTVGITDAGLPSIAASLARISSLLLRATTRHKAQQSAAMCYGSREQRNSRGECS